MLAAYLQEDVAISIKIGRFLPTCNGGVGGRSSENAAYLEKTCTQLSKIVFSSPVCFLKTMMTNRALHEFIESYFSNRTKPYEREEPVQLRVGPFLPKLDKLVVALYMRICAVYKTELSTAKNLATTEAGLSVASQGFVTDVRNRDVASLQSEFRTLVGGGLRALRLPFLLDLVAVLGETNSALSSQLLQEFLVISPNISSEVLQCLAESFKALQEVASCLDSAGGASNLDDLESFIRLQCDIVYNWTMFATVLPIEAFTRSGIFISSSGSLSEEGGLHLLNIARFPYEVVVPHVEKMLASVASNSDAVSKLRLLLHVIKLSAAGLLQRLIHVGATVSAELSSTSYPDGLTEHSWLEVFSSTQKWEDPSFGLSTSTGSTLLRDYLTRVPGAFQQAHSLLLGSLGDSDLVDSILSTAAPNMPLHNQAKETAARNHRDGKEGATASTALDTTSTAGNLQDKIRMIKDMFPDLGTAFIEACLRFYNENDSEVIDALLQDNLNPKLSVLDRSIEAIWFGKNRTDSTFGARIQGTSSAIGGGKESASSGGETVDILAYRQNQDFVETQKAYVRKMEAQRLEDARIIRREYDDDYDDQFDDVVAKKASVGDEDGQGGKGGDTRDWKTQMQEIRRYNTLLKDEEKEIVYWESMRNTNRLHGNALGGSRGGWKNQDNDTTDQTDSSAGNHAPASHGVIGSAHGKAVDSSTSDAATKQRDSGGKRDHGKGQKEPASTGKGTDKRAKEPKTNGETSSGGPDHTSNDKKPRTKTHDKHHQKDKQLKKLGAFRPT